MLAKVLVDPSREVVPLRIMNPTDRPITLYEGTVVGGCHPAEVLGRVEPATTRTSEAKKIPEPSQNKPDELEIHLHTLMNKSCTGLTQGEAKQVRKLLADNGDVFARFKGDLGRTDLVQHQINTGDARPIRQAPPRRLPIHKKEEAEKELEKKMLNQDVVEPSNSAWSSPVALVRKKDGSTRYCIDYRKLIDVTQKDS
ncbi:hypothetical protein HOLleu_42497 [Holothuria leucospilota]|uniref:Uncharacterized protein n=1 Tax=Holothuria leucospilota TaxID=206669 RepID=A0A9Q0YBK6_HOLLE|nr:hypothetical protein HOLleu_42497 [Holothuria leucospilota]